MACTFGKLLVENAAENPYPDHLKICNGGHNPVQECQNEIDKDFVQRYIKLVRSGYINRYGRPKLKEKFLICDNHRKIYGREFVRELR